LTRYIHALPQKNKLTVDNGSYPYSSYPVYLSVVRNRIDGLKMPAMQDEINEVYECLGEKGAQDDYGRLYEKYVNSLDDGEMTSTQKVLHRTAFVGSKDFSNEMRSKVVDHIKEEEKAKIVRKPNLVFVFSGSLIILFLSFVAYKLYGGQSDLQDALKATTTSFEVARDDLTSRVQRLQGEITGLMENKFNGLNDAVWEIELSQVKGVDLVEPVVDQLSFKNGQLVSLRLKDLGYGASEYSTTAKDNGEVVWQTVHVKPDGTKASWYGIWQNKKIRGILSERPAQGKGRDFSFVGIKRLGNG
jgi:hypothetical protein